MGGPVKAIQPDQPQEANPRVHTIARPATVQVPEVVVRLLGRANTLNVLSLLLEVTSRPRVGHAAKPTPKTEVVVRRGKG